MLMVNYSIRTVVARVKYPLYLRASVYDSTTCGNGCRLVGFNIFKHFPYPGISGQNWLLSWEIP